MSRQFTYGDQFSAGSQIDRLQGILRVILESANVSSKGLFEEDVQPYGDRSDLRQRIADEFFDHTNDSWGNAYNTLPSLDGYGLIELGEENFKPTELAARLRELSEDDSKVEFARHILTNLEGMLLLKVISDMKSRGEEPGLLQINYELNEIGIDIGLGTTYVSTMKSWLEAVDIFESNSYSSINWERVKEITGLNKEIIDGIYDLNREQKFYLLSLASIGAKEFVKSNDVANHTRTMYRVKLNPKNLYGDVLSPLEKKGLVETEKVSSAKPYNVRLTEKSVNEILEPFISRLQEATGLAFPTLDESFEDSVEKMSSEDKNEKGKALETFAAWMVRLLDLRFTEWRKRAHSTGYGEVDVMAASDKFVYNKWQIQCKNTQKNVSHKVLAREYGLTIATKADIIMIVTVSGFTSSAKKYARRLIDESNFYMVLINGEDIKRIKDDKTEIVSILNEKAEEAFFQKEVLSRGLGEEDD